MILRVRHQLRGEHIHADVFVGADGDHLSLSGRLVFSPSEWAALLPFAKQVATLVSVYVPSDEAVALEVER